MSKGGKGGSSYSAADQMKAAQEVSRQANIASGTNAINSTFDSQFTPDFYNGIKQGYLDYANPQVDKQYGDAQKQLTYSLTRSGNLDSSTRADQFGDLTGTYQSGRQQVADAANTQANSAASSVDASRKQLIASLNATGDATAAANDATAQAAALSARPSYSPISDLFSGVTGALAQQAQLERLSALSGGTYTPAHNTGLFTPRNAVVNR